MSKRSVRNLLRVSNWCLFLMVGALAHNTASAEIIAPNGEVSAKCGPKIKTKDVMVLDVEQFAGNYEAGRDFVLRHTGEMTLASEVPEVISTKMSSVWHSRKSGIKRASKEAAKRGCDVVIVLQAGTEITGHGWYQNSSGWGSTTTKRGGQALVLMGDRSTS